MTIFMSEQNGRRQEIESQVTLVREPETVQERVASPSLIDQMFLFGNHELPLMRQYPRVTCKRTCDQNAHASRCPVPIHTSCARQRDDLKTSKSHNHAVLDSSHDPR